MLKDYIRPSKLIDEMFEYTDMAISTYQIARAMLRVADALSFDGNYPNLKLAAKTLMDKAKVTNKRSFYSAIDWLSENGLIEVVKHGKKAPEYILHFDKPIDTHSGNVSGKLPQNLPQKVPQNLPQELPLNSATYIDGRTGRTDGHVVVVKSINNKAHVNETLEQNGLASFDDAKIEQLIDQLNKYGQQMESEDDLLMVFDYALKRATGLINVRNPVKYALGILKKFAGTGYYEHGSIYESAGTSEYKV